MDDGWWILTLWPQNRHTHRHTFNQILSSTFVPEWTWYEDSITLDQKTWSFMMWFPVWWYRESWIINQLEATLYWWVCRLGFDDGDAEWCHMFPLFSWKEARSGYRNLRDLRKHWPFKEGNPSENHRALQVGDIVMYYMLWCTFSVFSFPNGRIFRIFRAQRLEQLRSLDLRIGFLKVSIVNMDAFIIQKPRHLKNPLTPQGPPVTT